MGVSIIARDTHRSHSTHDRERMAGRRNCKRRKREGEEEIGREREKWSGILTDRK